MAKKFVFEPVEAVDPLTGEKRLLSAKEQEEMLERGILVSNPKKTDRGETEK